MPEYRFTGPYPVIYPAIPGPDGRSLSVQPGDIVTLPGIPGDGNWVPVVQGEVISEMAVPDVPVKSSAIAKRSA